VVVDSFLERRGAWMRRLSAKRKRLRQWRSNRLRPLLARLRLARSKQSTTTRAAHKSVALEALQLALEEEALTPHHDGTRTLHSPHAHVQRSWRSRCETRPKWRWWRWTKQKR
jgi:hypothetical protein